ncbi:DegV family protein with EDD domain [Salsuginibacillus halophilus]|uniref:DegV family protein with EDD domain n=1 Tax=Salsuginibacillus halophilus TaxID=517424 RepID=A0A2P8HQV6_9BACI|nr:DegV family protein [Salsuginibacillus halophilus]PSL48564.1 DegV family protein with EDD domain [Salsuginibacillus halophilus]
MANVAIVTDSTAYLSEEMLNAYNIHTIPLSVVFGEKTYREEIDMTTSTFYEKIQEVDQLPTTSQPPLGEFIKLYESLAETYDAVISIHLSSGISGTFATAQTAAESVEGIEVHPFDSEISCAPQGYFVLEAAERAAKGEDVDEIFARLEELRERIRAYFMVDNLNHLHRGGRLSGAQALVGSMLQIKPVLHFEDKMIVPFEKVRTSKKALNRIYELFEEDAGTGKPIRATVIHANRPAQAEEMKAELEKKFNNVTIDISYFGPVIGTHLGEGSLGLGWYISGA